MKQKFALVQASSCPDCETNLEAVHTHALQAKAAGCCAVCFPEAFLTSYAPEKYASLALEHDDPALAHLDKISQDLGIDLLVGYMKRCGGAFYLAHGVFRADGMRFEYCKTHLGQREQLYFTPGSTLDVFTLSCGMKIGFQLCLETHFPEITQTLSLKGAEIVFAPHAVPMTAERRRHLWAKYIPARAYDNRLYFACCNLLDNERFGGGCLAVDPDGEILASRFEAEPSILTFEADSDEVYKRRESGHLGKCHFYPRQRRPELYTEN